MNGRMGKQKLYTCWHKCRGYNDILRQLKITSTGIVKFLTGTQRNMLQSDACADPENFLRGGGGGWGVHIPRRGLTENFNMAKINNLAIQGGGGPVRTPCPPLWIRP